MDAFWNEVKASQSEKLPLLRVELGDVADPPFFFFDGSELLLSLSQDGADQQLAADAVAGSDLADVTPSAYFFFVHGLSTKGINTTKAALHILNDPKFAVPLPQHAMVLPQDMSLVYLLLPLPQQLWIASVRERLSQETNEAAELSLLTLLFYSQTQDSDAALEDAAKDATKSVAVRQSAQHQLQNERDVLAHKRAVSETEPALREARRARLAAVSDESIDEVQEMTAKLIIVRPKNLLP